MGLKTVRAILCFVNPNGVTCKNVNWSHYESRALLTASTSSSEAFNRFLVNTARIMYASKSELRNLYKIFFYEENKQERGEIKKSSCTDTIMVGKDLKLTILTE